VAKHGVYASIAVCALVARLAPAQEVALSHTEAQARTGRTVYEHVRAVYHGPNLYHGPSALR
jgi:hypothetical protein